MTWMYHQTDLFFICVFVLFFLWEAYPGQKIPAASPFSSSYFWLSRRRKWPAIVIACQSKDSQDQTRQSLSAVLRVPAQLVVLKCQSDLCWGILSIFLQTPEREPQTSLKEQEGPSIKSTSSGAYVLHARRLSQKWRYCPVLSLELLWDLYMKAWGPSQTPPALMEHVIDFSSEVKRCILQPCE